MAKRTDIHVKPSPKLREWLELAAKDEGRSLSNLTRRALEAYLQQHHADIEPVDSVVDGVEVATKRKKGGK